MRPEPEKKGRDSVRSKILIAVAGSILLLSALMYGISSIVLLDSYLSIERDAVAKDLGRVTDAIQEFSDQQMIKLSDWAAWDEAYNYAIERDSEWVESTIYATGMANLDINAAMFTDLEGKAFYLRAADIEKRADVATSALAAYFAANPHLVRHADLDDATQGIALLPDGPLIIVSLPLRTSEGEGPVPGSLTFARYLDDRKVEDLSAVTHLFISVYPYPSEDLPEDVATAKEALAKGAGNVIVPRSSEVIEGYTLIDGIDGEPALIAKIENPRPIYAQGQVAFLAFMLSSVLVIVLFGILMLFLIDRTVIARLIRLSEDVERVHDQKDISLRVAVESRDELGRLAEGLNRMLRWLEESKSAEADSRREIVNLLDSLKKEKELREETERLAWKKQGS